MASVEFEPVDRALTPDEVEALNKMGFERYLAFWKTVADVNGPWAGMVRQIAHGYTLEISNYRHDIYFRDRLEQVLRDGPASLRGVLAPIVARTDQQYKDVTWPVVLAISNPSEPREHWWQFRLPHVIPDYLLEDLKGQYDAELLARGYIDRPSDGTHKYLD